jgi:hypothetical protein
MGHRVRPARLTVSFSAVSFIQTPSAPTLIVCLPRCLLYAPARLVDEVVWVKMTVNRRLAKSHGYYLQHAKEALPVRGVTCGCWRGGGMQPSRASERGHAGLITETADEGARGDFTDRGQVGHGRSKRGDGAARRPQRGTTVRALRAGIPSSVRCSVCGVRPACGIRPLCWWRRRCNDWC